MNKVSPKIMPGFMELLPEDQILFNSMVDTIRETYESFGFLPLDTPILEYSEVLLAKAGGETEKQIYRFEKGDTDISMRFDLTVPLARYVSMRYNDLVFPFKRYQIGKVYRGERPQKGRYREFYQCDIDVIGEELSVKYDAEIPMIIYELFKKLGFGKFTIRLNNRRVLNGLFSSLNIPDSAEVLRVIDKIDKIGPDEVRKELSDLSLNDDVVSKIMNFIDIKGSNSEVLDSLKELGITDETFVKGIAQLEEVVSSLNKFGLDESYYKIDLTIARGLDYYTGTVFETILDEYPSLGSVCSGGRYDNLTEYYTDKALEGIGISIGITRLFYQLREAGIIKPISKSLSKVLIIPFSNDNLDYAMNIANSIREKSIICEVYLDDKPFKKKMNFANRLGIPYVCIIGDDEQKDNTVTIKNMETGEQNTIEKSKVFDYIK